VWTGALHEHPAVDQGVATGEERFVPVGVAGVGCGCVPSISGRLSPFERGSLTVGHARQVAGYLLPESHRVPVHRVAAGILI
jgi:hypothetical protein